MAGSPGPTWFWGDLNELTRTQTQQWELFLNILSSAMDTHTGIPTRTVALQPTDKRWMTPLVKSLINDRWAAYRHRNLELYAHLKMTVKYETQKAKERLC